MTWSNEKPTVPGWYFYRRDNQVHMMPLSIVNTTIGAIAVTSMNPYSVIGSYSHIALSQFPGEWAGPVEVPQ